ncbi:MAG TPA: hypothetical protein VKG02_15640, partial [Blastocatellia bacterium]|nr:hypothetical protein [Blastocatellia bacterium]
SQATDVARSVMPFNREVLCLIPHPQSGRASSSATHTKSSLINQSSIRSSVRSNRITPFS